MGSNHSQPNRHRKSSILRRQSSEVSEVSRKIEDKACVFIAMQGEVEKAISEYNTASMKALAAETAAHIMDLNQLKEVELTEVERARSQKVVYNFELSLAKLKSILNSDTIVKRKHLDSSAQFYANLTDPDLVSGLRRKTEDSSTSRPADETDLKSVEKELNAIKEQMKTHLKDINAFYQMDKKLFFLQVQLKQLEQRSDAALFDKREALLYQLTTYRSLLETYKYIIQNVHTLENLLNYSLMRDLPDLELRALEIQKSIQKIPESELLLENKFELMQRLELALDAIWNNSVDRSSTLKASREHIYKNRSSLDEQIQNLRAKEELEIIQSIDQVLEIVPDTYNYDDYDNEEAVYGNMEMIKHDAGNVKTKLEKRVTKNRGTVYANEDVVRQNNVSLREFSAQVAEKDMVNNRPPLPLPRNFDEKLIGDLPKHWRRLNEICNKESISEEDKIEVAEIQKLAEVAKNLFERKIRQLLGTPSTKCEAIPD